MYNGNWIYGRCAKVKRVTARNLAYSECEENIGDAVEQKEMLCGEVKTVRKFTFLGDRVNAGGVVRLLWLPENDVDWLGLRSSVSCCMAGDFL